MIELRKLGALLGGHRSSHGGEAVVDVIVHEGPLRIGNRLFHGMQLLGELQTGAPRFDHVDNTAEVPFRASEPFHNVWVGLVECFVCHTLILSRGTGYVKGSICHA